MTPPCPTCDRPTTLVALPETAMQVGDVVVRVQGLARATCEAGHATTLPAHADDAVLAEVRRRLVEAAGKGMARRRTVCGACRAELVLPPRRTERPVPTEADGHVVTATLEAPLLRCPDCGVDQLGPGGHDAVAAALRAAIAEAFG